MKTVWKAIAGTVEILWTALTVVALFGIIDSLFDSDTEGDE